MHAIKIWKNFDMKNFGEHHDNYLERDVLLLADDFGKFVSRSLEFYKLDSCYYFSSPRLSCDAMLKITKIQL